MEERAQTRSKTIENQQKKQEIEMNSHFQREMLSLKEEYEREIADLREEKYRVE